MQTFPDPDLQRVAGYRRSPDGFFEAVRLALGIMEVIRLDAWDDLPDDAYKVFESAGLSLTEEQADLLSAHTEKLLLLRRTRRASKSQEGRKRLGLAVCRACGGWRTFAAGVAGACPMCGAKLETPKALDSFAKVAERAAKAEALALKERVQENMDAPGLGELVEEPPSLDVEVPDLPPTEALDELDEPGEPDERDDLAGLDEQDEPGEQ